jgi:broad specificity phosphatase PhoE
MVRHAESIRNFACDLAREGDTQWLQAQLRDGAPESSWPLTPVGLYQSRIVGEWLRREGLLEADRFVRSPYLRAQQTSDAMGARALWVDDERLRERLWGKVISEYSCSAYLEDIALSSTFDWRADYEGAEALADLVPRVRSWLDDQWGAGRVLAVTHGGPLIALQHLLERDPPVRKLGNGAVVELLLERDGAAIKGQIRYAVPVFGMTEFTPWAMLNG